MGAGGERPCRVWPDGKDPLIDGNKRAAWPLRVLMLWINGSRHDFSTDKGFDLVVAPQTAI